MGLSPPQLKGKHFFCLAVGVMLRRFTGHFTRKVLWWLALPINENNGYNPIYWDCQSGGCYNVVHRPKIEVFAECLPGKIAMTDIDGTVEVNSHFLFFEFKSGGPRDIPLGQKLYFQRLTKISHKIKALVICADAETMVCTHLCEISNGVIGEWQTTTLEDLKARLNNWAETVSRKKTNNSYSLSKADEERAAICEYEANLPRGWAESFAALQAQSVPAGMPTQEWHKFIDAFGTYLDLRCPWHD